jgi:hypothetical protein
VIEALKEQLDRRHPLAPDVNLLLCSSRREIDPYITHGAASNADVYLVLALAGYGFDVSVCGTK